MKEGRFIFIVLVVMMIFPAMAVYAGTIDLPKTGQTACWDNTGASRTCAGTGEDGELQAGAAWPSPRFSVDTPVSGMITDNLTGLIWLKDTSTPTTGSPACTGGTKVWASALSYVACLNGGSGYLGYTDWRLPNLLEVNSLQNPTSGKQCASGDWFDTIGFTGAPGTSCTGDSYFWTSTTYAGQAGKAWAVEIRRGNVNEGGDGAIATNSKSSSTFYVWPVRGGI